MKKILLILLAGLLFLLAACSGEPTDDDSSAPYSPYPRWQVITASEAHRMMAELDSFILLDVRTEAEFQEMRIDGAVLIPYTEITRRAEAELPDKDAVILIYCRLGRRSALAAADLAALGYVNIYDLGGIANWPYETASG